MLTAQEVDIFTQRLDLLVEFSFPEKMNVFYVLRDLLNESNLRISNLGRKIDESDKRSETDVFLAVQYFCLGKLSDGDKLRINERNLIRNEVIPRSPNFYELFVEAVETVKKSRQSG